jgi:hypothetical protein
MQVINSAKSVKNWCIYKKSGPEVLCDPADYAKNADYNT